MANDEINVPNAAHVSSTPPPPYASLFNPFQKMIKTLIGFTIFTLLACTYATKPTQAGKDSIDVTNSFVIATFKTTILSVPQKRGTDIYNIKPNIHINAFDDDDSLVYVKDTKSLYFIRNSSMPYKSIDTFNQISVPAGDSARLDKKLLGFKLVGIFENPTYPPFEYVVFYVHPQKRDVLWLSHHLRIGNVADMILAVSDTINPVAGHEAEMAHLFGRKAPAKGDTILISTDTMMMQMDVQTDQ